MATLTGGRVAQKRRTRRALLDAAARLINDEHDPTIEDVAEAAGVSRATAYRYFSSVESLIAEVELLEGTEDPKTVIDREAGDDLYRRVEIAVTHPNKKLLDNEVALHVMARNLADRWLNGGDERVPRQGERFAWIDAALDGHVANCDPSTTERLRAGLGFLSGMEAVLSARDVAELTPEETLEVTAWAARSLLRAALTEAR